MKYIKDWKRILLDTTVLCSLFRSEKSTAPNSHDLFVRKLIEYLSNSKTSANEDRIFLISSVTVAEMLTNENDSDKIKRIMKVLDSKNTEFTDFDLEVAMEFNSQLRHRLDGDKLHERAKEIGFLTHDFAMAREWITRDYMIAMCGIVNNSDVILTADKKTFHPIIKDVPNSNCVLTFSDLFEQSEKFILSYKESEVEEFIKKLVTNPPKIEVTIPDIDLTNEKIINYEALISEAKDNTPKEEKTAETSQQIRAEDTL